MVDIGSGCEPHFGHWWDHSYLIRKGASTEITKRELESTIAALNVDLQSDQSVLICRAESENVYSYENDPFFLTYDVLFL